MTDSPDMSDDSATRQRKRDIAARWIQTGLSETEIRLKRAAGLGATPNVVPVGQPVLHGEPRRVHVGWHPVGGFAGKWFAEQTGLGKLITEKINSYPDPTQHWAVLVGDYAHQLWMDENFDVIYTNAKVNPEEWQLFPVGHTRFNDDAIRRSGEAVIAQIREKQAAYNLISNNCQTYALRLLDAIKADGANHFPTTLNVYETLTGPGRVVDLFKPIEAGTVETDETVSNAQACMNQHTTRLDTHGPAVDPSNPAATRRMPPPAPEGVPQNAPATRRMPPDMGRAPMNQPPAGFPSGFNASGPAGDPNNAGGRRMPPPPEGMPMNQERGMGGAGEGVGAGSAEGNGEGAESEEKKKKPGLFARMMGKK